MYQLLNEIYIINPLISFICRYLHSSHALKLNGFIISKCGIELVRVIHDTKQISLTDHVVGATGLKDPCII